MVTYIEAEGKKIILKPNATLTFEHMAREDHEPIDVYPILKYFTIPQGEVTPNVTCNIVQDGKILKTRPLSNIAFGTTDTKAGKVQVIFENHEGNKVLMKLRITAGRLHKEIELNEVSTS